MTGRRAALASMVALGRRTGGCAADFVAHLFDQQRAYVEGPERFKIALTARRAGKTTAVGSGLLTHIDRRPGRVAAYLTLTRKNARRILWPTVLELLDRLHVGYSINKTDLEIRLRGGGTLLIGGVDTHEQVERWRGYAYAAVAIDECQSFPSTRLRALVQDVIRPGLADYRGPLFLTGTPGRVPTGYWFDLSGPSSHHHVYRWTGLDNPHLPDFASELAAIRKENGWTETSPTYQREYCGQWVLDWDALVYRYDEDRNSALALPKTADTGAPLDASQWRYVLAVDVGSVHETAYVVMAAHPGVPHDYVVHAERQPEMTSSRMAARIVELLGQYPGPVIMDTGGMGRRYADECVSRYGLPIEAAYKADKGGGIRIIRDRLLEGNMRLLPEARALAEEWRTLIWNEAHTDHERDQRDHCADAAIYAIKRLRNYTTDHLQPQPERGSREWYEQEEERMRQRIVKRRPTAQRHRGRWDR